MSAISLRDDSPWLGPVDIERSLVNLRDDARVPLSDNLQSAVRVRDKTGNDILNVFERHFFVYKLAKEVGARVNQHGEDVVNVAKLFAGLFILLENVLKIILGHGVHQVPDPELEVVFLGHAPNLNLLDVVHELAKVKDNLRLRWNPVPGPKLARCVQLVDARNAPARNVAGVAVRNSPEAPKLVKVRVVDDTAFDPQRVPVKRRVAIRTPHLRAPGYFEYHGSAVGTRFRILLEELHGFDVFGLALVGFVRLDLVALVANPVFANLALPLRRKKPATVLDGALAHKLSLFGRNRLALTPDVFNLEMERVHLARQLGYPFRVLSDKPVALLPVCQNDLGIREETLFALKENVFSVTF